jgi:hypothetical protein
MGFGNQYVFHLYCMLLQEKIRKKGAPTNPPSGGISVAIPSLFAQPSYPTIPLEPLQRE